MYTKVECLKKNWVLVLSFMYLVSVDPMNRSLNINAKLKQLRGRVPDHNLPRGVPNIRGAQYVQRKGNSVNRYPKK